MGVLDQDVDAQTVLRFPQLYYTGILRREWTQTKFWYLYALNLKAVLIK